MDREIQGSDATLPSLGVPYEGRIPGGKVVVSPMTTREEKMLASGGPDSGLSLIDNLIKNCVHGPEDMSPDDYLVGDRMFLMMAIRSVSFGDEYEFTVNCASCKQPFRSTVMLPDDVEMIHLKEGFQEPFEVELPMSKLVLGLRLLRGKDEKDMARQQKRVYKRVDASKSGDPMYTYRMLKHIEYVKVPGEEEPIETSDQIGYDKVEKIFNELVVRDSMALRNALSENDCGVNTFQEFSCPQCRDVFTAPLPVDIEFFRPGGDRGIRYL